MVNVISGDSLNKLQNQDENTFDSCVTDPPYELGFMGKRWDESGIAFNQEFWEEVYRVLKPGAHLLAFGGTRTHHRMMVAIEDAGFEIRDTLMWIYGGGFPKNHDVSKALDKAAGVEREVVGQKTVSRDLSRNGKKGDMAISREPVEQTEVDITAPATEEAKKWKGWGTALKPAHEPIVLARKPLSGTVVETVLKHGTGAINIDGCRITTQDSISVTTGSGFSEGKFMGNQGRGEGTMEGKEWNMSNDGRYPANLILDDRASVILDDQSGIDEGGKTYDYSDEKSYEVEGFVPDNKPNSPSNRGDSGGASRFFHTVENKGRYPANLFLDERASVMLDDQSGETKSGAMKEAVSGYESDPSTEFIEGVSSPQNQHGDSGGASRFFYCPKANGDKDRHLGVEKNTHPTVKPIELMGYLVRLITPKDGHVLDPFAGSGTTGIAAQLEGVSCTLIEKDEESAEISKKRNEYVKANLPEVKRDLYEDPSNKITEEQTKVNDHSFW
jgi:site-specific DNA-methyltransferase (adenine-specific)